MSGRSNRTPTHIDKVDAWHTVYLEQCIVHWNDQTSAIKYDRNTGRKPGSRAQNWYLQLGYQKDDHSQHLQFRAVDSNNTLVAKVDFPTSKSSISIDVNLFEVTFTIQIKEIGPNDSIKAVYFFKLGVKSDMRMAFNLFQCVRQNLQRTPYSLVRHTNVPRPLLPGQDHGLQTLTPAQNQVRRVAIWHIPGMPEGTIQFTGFLASVEIEKIWPKVTGERLDIRLLPVDGSTGTAAPLPLAASSSSASADVHHKQWVTCGQCKMGQAPTDVGQVRARRFRKEWIGCREGIDCKSSSYWFHVKDCSGISIETGEDGLSHVMEQLDGHFHNPNRASSRLKFKLKTEGEWFKTSASAAERACKVAFRIGIGRQLIQNHCGFIQVKIPNYKKATVLEKFDAELITRTLQSQDAKPNPRRAPILLRQPGLIIPWEPVPTAPPQSPSASPMHSRNVSVGQPQTPPSGNRSRAATGTHTPSHSRNVSFGGPLERLRSGSQSNSPGPTGMSPSISQQSLGGQTPSRNVSGEGQPQGSGQPVTLDQINSYMTKLNNESHAEVTRAVNYKDRMYESWRKRDRAAWDRTFQEMESDAAVSATTAQAMKTMSQIPKAADCQAYSQCVQYIDAHSADVRDKARKYADQIYAAWLENNETKFKSQVAALKDDRSMTEGLVVVVARFGQMRKAQDCKTVAHCKEFLNKWCTGAESDLVRPFYNRMRQARKEANQAEWTKVNNELYASSCSKSVKDGVATYSKVPLTADECNTRAELQGYMAMLSPENREQIKPVSAHLSDAAQDQDTEQYNRALADLKKIPNITQDTVKVCEKLAKNPR
ncbi:hypothetical protein LTR96_000002 [Exophiala xenobiotica]|nr:hypothetical protein LTR96_000002 [Exophiala xenobiotica]